MFEKGFILKKSQRKVLASLLTTKSPVHNHDIYKPFNKRYVHSITPIDPPWAVEPPRAPGQPQPLAIEVDRARIVSETRLAPDTYDSRSRRAARQAAEIGRLSYANASGPGLGTRMATELCSVRTSLRSVKAKDQGPGPAHWQRARSVYTRRAWSLSLFTD